MLKPVAFYALLKMELHTFLAEGEIQDQQLAACDGSHKLIGGIMDHDVHVATKHGVKASHKVETVGVWSPIGGRA